MLSTLLDTSNPFVAFTADHWWPVIAVSLFVAAVIILGRALESDRSKRLLGVGLALLPPMAVLIRVAMTVADGTFSITTELPFHLCRTLAFMFPFIIWNKSRKWFGITYFLAVAGTTQAILTPDIAYSAPHFDYWLYWILHCVLVLLPFYCIVVWGFRITKRDFVNALIALNVYLLATGVINMILGSNYFYTSHKPPGPTLLDALGPWPWYIVVAEGLAIVLFALVGLPFWISRKDKTDEVP